MPYIRQAQKNAGKVIVIDPRKTPTAKSADLYVPIRPGTDWILMNGILHIMIREGWIDPAFIDQRTRGYEQVKETVTLFDPVYVSERTDVPEEKIFQIAEWYGKANTGIILTARGIEQQTNGVKNVLACINLALASGKIGRPGCGFGAVTGQANGQGGREHGQKSDQLPGYRSIENAEHRAHIANIWGIDEMDLPRKGSSAFEMIGDIASGEIRGMFVLASNPVVSSPHKGFVKEAFSLLDTLIVVDIFHTETTAMADIVLPGSAFTEDEGTVTNLEGRVIYRHAVQNPPGHARRDWEILCEIAARLGKKDSFNYASVEQIFQELRRASGGGIADYYGITYERIRKEKGVFWPCPSEDHPGSPRVFTERFAHPDGKAVFHKVTHDEADEEEKDLDFLYLTTGRVIHHYLTGVQTRRTVSSNAKCKEPYVEVHPLTASKFGLSENELAEIKTSFGRMVCKVKLTTDIRPDTLFVPFHWEGEQSVNQVVASHLDPVSKMPGFKRTLATLQKYEEVVTNDG
ncbi:hypothetical protein DNHGIG_23020 [Collibacillus ludicampi]|uniref:Nitrite reductase n=1 Tax=Collibacillus ludicampi TaxID=2771369 RepID=A0AAV4LGF9_9BACL|nr:hypothetical protein DNHGIG_23020 [Collibacillus ludicampi]